MTIVLLLAMTIVLLLAMTIALLLAMTIVLLLAMTIALLLAMTIATRLAMTGSFKGCGAAVQMQLEFARCGVGFRNSATQSAQVRAQRGLRCIEHFIPPLRLMPPLSLNSRARTRPRVPK
jgi:hypothetical protein